MPLFQPIWENGHDGGGPDPGNPGPGPDPEFKAHEDTGGIVQAAVHVMVIGDIQHEDLRFKITGMDSC